jgi:hypothetical protein
MSSKKTASNILKNTEKIIPQAVDVNAIKKLFFIFSISPLAKSKPNNPKTVPSIPNNGNMDIIVRNIVYDFDATVA